MAQFTIYMYRLTILTLSERSGANLYTGVNAKMTHSLKIVVTGSYEQHVLTSQVKSEIQCLD